MKNSNGTIYHIKDSQNLLTDELIEEIQNLDIPVYWNDSQSKHFIFDTKLSNDVWIESIYINNELTEFHLNLYKSI